MESTISIELTRNDLLRIGAALHSMILTEECLVDQTDDKEIVEQACKNVDALTQLRMRVMKAYRLLLRTES